MQFYAHQVRQKASQQNIYTGIFILSQDPSFYTGICVIRYLLRSNGVQTN